MNRRLIILDNTSKLNSTPASVAVGGGVVRVCDCVCESMCVCMSACERVFVYEFVCVCEEVRCER